MAETQRKEEKLQGSWTLEDRRTSPDVPMATRATSIRVASLASKLSEWRSSALARVMQCLRVLYYFRMERCLDCKQWRQSIPYLEIQVQEGLLTLSYYREGFWQKVRRRLAKWADLVDHASGEVARRHNRWVSTSRI